MTPPNPSDLVHCLPVRLTAELERGIKEHRAYLQRRMLRSVSLAEACRDLFARALQFAPTRVGARRRRCRKPGQLGLSFTPKGEPARVDSSPVEAEAGNTTRGASGGTPDA